MRWYVSDHHFNHKNIISFCSRPFDNLEMMHSGLIKRHNALVGPEDEVYILGDFDWNPQWVSAHLKAMNGKKHLIAGNHDKCHPVHKNSGKWKDFYLKAGFSSVETEAIIQLDKYKVKLHHFPYYNPSAQEAYNLRYKEWRPVRDEEDQILLFGHTHCTREFREVWDGKYLSINVGVDANFWKPNSEEEILEIIRKYIP